MCFFHHIWMWGSCKPAFYFPQTVPLTAELTGAFPPDLKGARGTLNPSQRGLESPGAPLWTSMWKWGIKGLQRQEVLSAHRLTAADFLPTQIWQFNGARHTLSPARKLPQIQQEPEAGGRQGSQRKPPGLGNLPELDVDKKHKSASRPAVVVHQDLQSHSLNSAVTDIPPPAASTTFHFILKSKLIRFILSTASVSEYYTNSVHSYKIWL